MNEPLRWWEQKRPPPIIACLAVLYKLGGKTTEYMKYKHAVMDEFGIKADSTASNALLELDKAGMIRREFVTKTKIASIELADWEKYRPAVMEWIEKKPSKGKSVVPIVITDEQLRDDELIAGLEKEIFHLKSIIRSFHPFVSSFDLYDHLVKENDIG